MDKLTIDGYLNLKSIQTNSEYSNSFLMGGAGCAGGVGGTANTGGSGGKGGAGGEGGTTSVDGTAGTFLPASVFCAIIICVETVHTNSSSSIFFIIIFFV